MRFASLGSGSRGNATLVSSGRALILVDCGFSAIEARRRMALLGVDPGRIDAILVTHEHGDHVRGVGPLARRYGIPLWSSQGTALAAGLADLDEAHCFPGQDGCLRIGDIEVSPYPVPHDAREPTQFVFSRGGRSLGLLTDAGHVTAHILERLRACQALILEFNHDPGMLRDGPYPPRLQARVGGAYGHLANPQATALLARLDRDHCRRLAAAHLSAKNNHPERVREAIDGVWPGHRPVIWGQDGPSDWIEL